VELVWKIGLAAAGGAVGSALRVFTGHFLGRPGAFPWATFGINVLGSFLLGFLFATAKDRTGWYILLGAGFCGGFTTFSAFSLETLGLVESGRLGEAVAYAAGSVLAGLAAVWLGVLLAKWI
jgi:fluoride exporter